MNLTEIFQSNNTDSVILVAKKLLDLLHVPATKSGLSRSMEQHPDYPMLTSFSDVLESYGVESAPVKATIENVLEFPVPFVAHVRNVNSHKDELIIVTRVDEEGVFFFHPHQPGLQKIVLEEFIKRWHSRIVLLVDGESCHGEKDFQTNKKKERQITLARILGILFIPLLILIGCIAGLLSGNTNIWAYSLFMISSLGGAFFSALLIQYELGEDNWALKHFCPTGKKISCNAVLSSRASSIGGISWSKIGFVYFGGTTLFLLISGAANIRTIFLFSWLSFLALPYVVFSLLYQWRVVKQWCLLCLAVQLAIITQFSITVFTESYALSYAASLSAITHDWVILLLSFSLPALLIFVLLTALKSSKELRQSRMELTRLKNNGHIFQTLLLKQKQISEAPDNLGILIGDPNARNKIVKVCNPYCGPCAKAHAALDEMMKDNDQICMQIIFTATGEVTDKKTLPVAHLMTIAENGGQCQLRQALNDWYLSGNKDYNLFSTRYTLDQELSAQKPKLRAMNSWCERIGISKTPTVFINGFQLPEMYDLEDLKHYLATGND
ncbi:MAG TPA: vitamin K epoxide reductase family protein [Chitinophagaceae bacterium]|nr:vitamin K epoxide reductase family protein [Chitinophagaceae bacterium]